MAEGRDQTARKPAVPSLSYLPQLDGIRGVAVLLVVIYHLTYLTAGWGPRLLPGGFIGVDVFFALSGFLITTGIISQLEPGRFELGQFATRRARRLVPALVVTALGVAVLVPLLGSPFDDVLRRSVVGSMLYISNWQQAAGRPFLVALSHTWSLSIEAQFYLVWPLVLMLMYRLRLPRPLMAGIVLLAAAASAADRWHMWTDQAHFLPVYLRTDTHADGILLGCLAALACAWGWVGPRAGRRLRIPALAAIGVLVFVCLESETGDVRLYHGPLLSIVAVGCAVLVVAAVLDPGWALHRCWPVAPLRFLGQRSYSLYLWHVPVFVLVAEHLGDRPVWLRLAVGLLPTALVTELSYRLVENRFRHRSARTAGAAVTPKAA